MTSCPLELWFPKRLYEYFCALHYIEGAYPNCQYICHDSGQWIVCQLVKEEVTERVEEEKPKRREVRSLKEFLDRL